MVSVRLRYVVEDKDRHGNARLYVRVPGTPKVRLRETPGTAAFLIEYEAAIARTPAKPTLPAETTFRGLCARYYASPIFGALDPATQSWRRRYLDRLCVKDGDKPHALLTRKHVKMRYEELIAKPGAARMRLKAMKALFKWAVDAEVVQFDPTRDVRVKASQSDGHHTWEEMPQMERTAWLIETGDHKYWNGEARLGKPMLTAEPDKAVRFAREADANQVIYHLFEEYAGFLVAREHGWI